MMALEPQNEGKTSSSRSAKSMSAKKRVTGIEKKLVSVSEASSVYVTMHTSKS